MRDLGFKNTLLMTRVCYPDAAKNRLLREAMEVDPEAYYLFLDADQFYPKDTAARLCGIVEKFDAIALGHTLKRNGQPMSYGFDEEGNTRMYTQEIIDEMKGLCSIGGGGFGGVMVKKSIIDKMPKPYFKDWICEDEALIDGKDQDHNGEDVYFFKNARKAGVKTILDRDLKFGHLTTQAV